MLLTLYRRVHPLEETIGQPEQLSAKSMRRQPLRREPGDSLAVPDATVAPCEEAFCAAAAFAVAFAAAAFVAPFAVASDEVVFGAAS